MSAETKTKHEPCEKCGENRWKTKKKGQAWECRTRAAVLTTLGVKTRECKNLRTLAVA